MFDCNGTASRTTGRNILARQGASSRMAQGRILIPLKSHKLILVPVHVPSTARTAHSSSVGAVVMVRRRCASRLGSVVATKMGRRVKVGSRSICLRIWCLVSFLSRAVVETCLGGTYRLEWRGFDSAGCATFPTSTTLAKTLFLI
jgi:hypothetical protein